MRSGHYLITDSVVSICLNGEFLNRKEKCLDVSNRAFRYGDAFFESIRLINGRPVFLERHFDRLKRAFVFFGFEFPESLELNSMIALLKKLAFKNGVENGGKARIIIWRKPGGLYGPESSSVEFLIECEQIDQNEFLLNSKGLNIEVFDGLRINPAPQSSHKTTNAIPYVQASRWAAKNRFDDALMVDVEGNLAEATSSNLFVLTEGKLVTPDLEFGGLHGTMRQTVIDLVSRSNIQIDQAKLRVDDLDQAEEIFLTNASSGVKWVGAFRKKRYYKRLSYQLIKLLNQEALIS